jgi:hypothetical protein
MVLPIVAAIFAIVTTTLPFPINAATAITAASASTATTVSTADACFYCRRLFLLPTPVSTADACFSCRRFRSMSFSTTAGFYCYDYISTDISTAAAKVVFYHLHLLPPLFAIATAVAIVLARIVTPMLAATRQHRFLSTPLNFYRHLSFSIDNISYRRCIRQLPFSAVAIDTTCYRHHLLSTPLAIDTACYHHRFLSLFLLPPFSTAIATTAILREVALCHD